MRRITDLGISALIRHCSIVSNFSSERMMEVKKRQRRSEMQPILTSSIDG